MDKLTEKLWKICFFIMGMAFVCLSIMAVLNGMYYGLKMIKEIKNENKQETQNPIQENRRWNT